MRQLTAFMGILLMGVGFFSFANRGLAFIGVAFIIGIALMLVGVILIFSYKKHNQETEESVHWILIEGLTTFILGIIVLTGYLSADVAVQAVFGLWIMITGIRNVVISYDDFQRGEFKFNWAFAIGVVDFIAGIAGFFNTVLLSWPVLMLVGTYLILQGANIIEIGLTVNYSKPDLIKTKEEIVAEAAEAVENKVAEVHEVIQAAKEAKQALADAIEAPDAEEIMAAPIEFETHPKEEE